MGRNNWSLVKSKIKNHLSVNIDSLKLKKKVNKKNNDNNDNNNNNNNDGQGNYDSNDNDVPINGKRGTMNLPSYLSSSFRGGGDDGVPNVISNNNGDDDSKQSSVTGPSTSPEASPNIRIKRKGIKQHKTPTTTSLSSKQHNNTKKRNSRSKNTSIKSKDKLMKPAKQKQQVTVDSTKNENHFATDNDEEITFLCQTLGIDDMKYFCLRHPDQIITTSIRHFRYEPIHTCSICTNEIHHQSSIDDDSTALSKQRNEIKTIIKQIHSMQANTDGWKKQTHVSNWPSNTTSRQFSDFDTINPNMFKDNQNGKEEIISEKDWIEQIVQRIVQVQTWKLSERQTPIKYHHVYARYFRLLKLGVPVDAIQFTIEKDGYDPKIITYNPNLPLLEIQKRSLQDNDDVLKNQGTINRDVQNNDRTENFNEGHTSNMDVPDIVTKCCVAFNRLRWVEMLVGAEFLMMKDESHLTSPNSKHSQSHKKRTRHKKKPIEKKSINQRKSLERTSKHFDQMKKNESNKWQDKVSDWKSSQMTVFDQDDAIKEKDRVIQLLQEELKKKDALIGSLHEKVEQMERKFGESKSIQDSTISSNQSLRSLLDSSQRRAQDLEDLGKPDSFSNLSIKLDDLKSHKDSLRGSFQESEAHCEGNGMTQKKENLAASASVEANAPDAQKSFKNNLSDEDEPSIHALDASSTSKSLLSETSKNEKEIDRLVHLEVVTTSNLVDISSRRESTNGSTRAKPSGKAVFVGDIELKDITVPHSQDSQLNVGNNQFLSMYGSHKEHHSDNNPVNDDGSDNDQNKDHVREQQHLETALLATDEEEEVYFTKHHYDIGGEIDTNGPEIVSDDLIAVNTPAFDDSQDGQPTDEMNLLDSSCNVQSNPPLSTDILNSSQQLENLGVVVDGNSFQCYHQPRDLQELTISKEASITDMSEALVRTNDVERRGPTMLVDGNTAEDLDGSSENDFDVELAEALPDEDNEETYTETSRTDVSVGSEENSVSECAELASSPLNEKVQARNDYACTYTANLQDTMDSRSSDLADENIILGETRTLQGQQTHIAIHRKDEKIKVESCSKIFSTAEGPGQGTYNSDSRDFKAHLNEERKLETEIIPQSFRSCDTNETSLYSSASRHHMKCGIAQAKPDAQPLDSVKLSERFLNDLNDLKNPFVGEEGSLDAFGDSEGTCFDRNVQVNMSEDPIVEREEMGVDGTPIGFASDSDSGSQATLSNSLDDIMAQNRIGMPIGKALEGITNTTGVVKFSRDENVNSCPEIPNEEGVKAASVPQKVEKNIIHNRDSDIELEIIEDMSNKWLRAPSASPSEDFRNASNWSASVGYHNTEKTSTNFLLSAMQIKSNMKEKRLAEGKEPTSYGSDTENLKSETITDRGEGKKNVTAQEYLETTLLGGDVLEEDELLMALSLHAREEFGLGDQEFDDELDMPAVSDNESEGSFSVDSSPLIQSPQVCLYTNAEVKVHDEEGEDSYEMDSGGEGSDCDDSYEEDTSVDESKAENDGRHDVYYTNDDDTYGSYISYEEDDAC